MDEQNDREADPFRVLMDSMGTRDGMAEVELLSLWYDVMRRPSTAALAAWGRLWRDYLPWVERRLVCRARRDGLSWSAIGRLLGRSRQAVQERHDRAFTPGEMFPPRARKRLGEGEADERRVTAADRQRARFADDAAAEGDLVPW